MRSMSRDFLNGRDLLFSRISDGDGSKEKRNSMNLQRKESSSSSKSGRPFCSACAFARLLAINAFRRTFFSANSFFLTSQQLRSQEMPALVSPLQALLLLVQGRRCPTLELWEEMELVGGGAGMVGGAVGGGGGGAGTGSGTRTKLIEFQVYWSSVRPNPLLSTSLQYAGPLQTEGSSHDRTI